MLVSKIMQVLKNLFGLNKKISAYTIAIKDREGNADTLDNYLDINYCTNYIDGEEIPTNEFLNGKRVYAKRLITSETMNGTDNLAIEHGITDFQYIWVDLANSFYVNGESGLDAYYRCLPLIQTFYTSVSSTERTSIYIDGAYVYLVSNGGWGATWKKIITVKYTKKND